MMHCASRGKKVNDNSTLAVGGRLCDCDRFGGLPHYWACQSLPVWNGLYCEMKKGKLTCCLSCRFVSGKHSVCAAVYQQVWSFGYPVPGVSRAVVLACQDDEGNAVSLIAFSCLEDIQLTRQTGRGHVDMFFAAGLTRQLVWSEPAATDNARNTRCYIWASLTASLCPLFVLVDRTTQINLPYWS